MSFESFLIFDDGMGTSPVFSNSIKVLEFDWTISQQTDSSGYPSESPKGALISLTIESTSDTNVLDWVVSYTAKRSGKIVFTKRDGQGKMRTLTFIDASCVGYQESFDSQLSNPMKLSFVLAPSSIKVGSSEYSFVPNPPIS